MASMDKIALLELTREDRFGGWGYRFSAGGFEVIAEEVMDARSANLSVLSASNEALSARITEMDTDADSGIRGLEPLNCKFSSFVKAVISPVY